MSQIYRGLEGIIVAESDICFIDGLKGILEYRGINIHELAERSSFEETAFLLWYGKLPTRNELDEFSNTLREHRNVDPTILNTIKLMPRHALPMEVMRTTVSMLSMYDERSEDPSYEAIVKKAIRIAAKMPTMATAYDRYRRGLEAIPPHSELSHAGNLLYMLNGKIPKKTAERTMDVALILHAEHGLNASTFGGRVTSSTLSDLYSAITSAIGTLKGPLHGGANAAAMRMLLEIGDLDRVDEWIEDALARKQRIMGFGHRVYKTMDPRATILKAISSKLAKGSTSKWFDMSVRIQEILHKEKNLWPNVDFYSASAYYMMGIPIDLFTTIFVISRITGWAAHILEQRKDNRLIRPRAKYIGGHDIPYTSMNERV